MNIIVLEHKYCIYKFKNESTFPGWIYSSDFYSVTKTGNEISVVTIQPDSIPEDIICNGDWRILKIKGPLDLSLVGIIAEVSTILKNKKVPIFIISTFDTDYILVKQKDLNIGIKALEEKGHNILIEE